MSDPKPTAQPNIVIEQMYEIVKDRYEYCDQYALKLKILNMKQTAEINGLKDEIDKLKQQIIELKMEKHDG